MAKKLSAYPKAISTLERQILKHIAEVLRPLEESQARLELAADHLVVENAELKNELQRRLYRVQVLESDEYTALCVQLQAARDRLQLLRIDLARLQNEFSAEKLVERGRIAAVMQELEVMGNW